MTESHLRAGTPPKKRREFGSIRRLKSGRYQARWRDPDGKMVPGPHTFVKSAHARTFLNRVESDLVDGVYKLGEGDDTFTEWGEMWLDGLRVAKSPKYVEECERIFRRDLEPVWGSHLLTRITGREVLSWHKGLKPNAPTMRVAVYDQFSRMLNAAVANHEQRIKHNPCKIPGASSKETARESVVLTPDQLVALVEAFPKPYQFLCLLSCWVALRFSEFTEIRRKDLTVSDDGTFDVLHVARGITRTTGESRNPTKHIGKPKARSSGQVVIPPHLHEELVVHLEVHTGSDDEALLFPSAKGVQLSYSTFHNMFSEAVAKARENNPELFADVPHLRPHDFRHTGSSYAGEAKATLAQLMNRMRHKTVSAAMRYQHADLLQDKALAERLSTEIAGAAPRLRVVGSPAPAARDSDDHRAQLRAEVRTEVLAEILAELGGRGTSVTG